jgi:vesicular inhibitory amino acid transporter
MIGIVSTVSIIAVVFIDGFSKRDSPGSLWSPSDTQLGIGSWGELGVAFGLFMAGV